MANQIETKEKENDPYVRWLSEVRGLSQTTIDLYALYYKHFSKNGEEITQKKINVFIAQRKNNSVVRGFMRSFLDFLKENNFDVEAFVIPKRKTGKKKQKIIRDFSSDQIKKVRVYSYDQSLRDGLLIDLVYYGALRRVELLPIKINSFDWSTYFEDPSKFCKLLITGKGKKQREVLIHPDPIKKLLDYYLQNKVINVEMSKDVLINTLTSNNSQLFKGIYSRKVWQIINRNSKRSIGIAIRPHELRHTRATELEKSGASIRSVQHYLGHSSPQITEIYLHTTQTQSLQKMMDVVND